MKDILARNINVFLADHREEELVRLINELHPADIAEIIDFLEDEQKLVVFNLLDPELASEVLLELADHSRDFITNSLSVEQLSEMVAEMDSDDAADFVAELSQENATAVLEAIEPDESADVRRLLLYKEDTAGGIMQIELIAAQEDDTVDDAINRIRASADEVGDISFVFVIDPNRVLRGQISLRKLLLASPEQKVKAVMSPPEMVIEVDEDQEEVAQKFQKYDLRSAPVVDSQGRLLGRITVDDIFDVFHEEVDEDFQRMAGLGEVEIYGDPVLTISRLRLPWLLANLTGGLVTGYLVWLFKITLQDVLALVTFIPAIMALGGSVGIQSSTLVVRGLALGRINVKQTRQILFKEFRVALVMGLACGIGGAVVAKIWHGRTMLGLVVGLSIVAAITLSSILGAAAPVIFRRFNIDPALASGPFVTMCNDILGILIYMGIATVFLKYLMY
jgi:magnesium transporter